jgi:hypothetical protein
MTDSSSSKSSSSSSKKKTKKSTKDELPSFKHMITEAIWEEKKWTKGTSRHAIRKFIVDTYDVDEDTLKKDISNALSDMLQNQKNGKPCLVKVDANYKLTPEWRKEWKSKNGIKPEKRKKKKDPDAPKGTRNGYMFYVQEHRAKRGKEHPDKGAAELTKMIGAEWKDLSDSKKKKYLDLAAEDKKRYQREMKEYNKRKHSSESEESEKRAKKKRKTVSSDSSSSDKKKKKKSSSSSDDKKKKSKKKSNTSEESSEEDDKAKNKEK